MKQPEFVNNEIYHIYNRGVEKRDIFSEEKDYFRFIHDLLEFNDILSAGRFSEVGLPKVENPRKLLINILAFCLMPNHYHLLLMQKKEGGITKFMRKMGTGYTNYFNKKYDRVGPLFQGKFKAKLVKNDEYLLHLSNYIHLNPIELVEREWPQQKIENINKAKLFLKNYKWSSLSDYLGKQNFPSITQREFLMKFFNNDHEVYEQTIFSWLDSVGNQSFVKNIASFSEKPVN